MRAKTINHAHCATRHMKLRGPDWALSELMLDRTMDAINRRVGLVRDYHVPYLAGYSEDGLTIYIDRDLPPSFINRGGDTITVDRYLMLHESVEKSLIHHLGLHYQHAHQIALRTEQAAVTADGISWNEYDRFMQKWIKEAEESHSLHLPPDLDLRPYIDEHDKDLVQVMRQVMKRTKAALASKPRAKRRTSAKKT
jgi:hypothetical protein